MIRRYARFAVVVVAVAVLTLGLAVQAQGPGKLSVALNDRGITYGPNRPVGNQDYQITVKNFASGPRGFKISGKDRAGSDMVRYTDILGRGQTQTINLYVPRNTTLRFREMLTCEKADGSCVKATYGRHTANVRFR